MGLFSVSGSRGSGITPTSYFVSLRAACVALLIMLPFAAVAAWCIARSSSRFRHVVDVLVTLPLALPPVVVGFALLWLVGARGPFSGALSGLAYTWFMMSIAAAVVALPLTVRAFTSALSDVDVELEQTARNLGASRLRVLATITFSACEARRRGRGSARFRTRFRRVRRHDSRGGEYPGADARNTVGDMD